jgi:hypothetical protein
MCAGTTRDTHHSILYKSKTLESHPQVQQWTLSAVHLPRKSVHYQGQRRSTVIGMGKKVAKHGIVLKSKTKLGACGSRL